MTHLSPYAAVRRSKNHPAVIHLIINTSKERTTPFHFVVFQDVLIKKLEKTRKISNQSETIRKKSQTSKQFEINRQT